MSSSQSRDRPGDLESKLPAAGVGQPGRGVEGDPAGFEVDS